MYLKGYLQYIRHCAEEQVKLGERWHKHQKDHTWSSTMLTAWWRDLYYMAVYMPCTSYGGEPYAHGLLLVLVVYVPINFLSSLYWSPLYWSHSQQPNMKWCCKCPPHVVHYTLLTHRISSSIRTKISAAQPWVVQCIIPCGEIWSCHDFDNINTESCHCKRVRLKTLISSYRVGYSCQTFIPPSCCILFHQPGHQGVR